MSTSSFTLPETGGVLSQLITLETDKAPKNVVPQLWPPRVSQSLANTHLASKICQNCHLSIVTNWYLQGSSDPGNLISTWILYLPVPLDFRVMFALENSKKESPIFCLFNFCCSKNRSDNPQALEMSQLKTEV